MSGSVTHNDDMLPKKFIDEINAGLDRPATQQELRHVGTNGDLWSWEYHGHAEDAIESIEILRRELARKKKRQRDEAEHVMFYSGWSTSGVPVEDLALSHVLAAEASEDPRLKAFRATLLGDRLLRPEEIEQWLDQIFFADRMGNRERQLKRGKETNRASSEEPPIEVVDKDGTKWHKVRTTIPPFLPGDTPMLIYVPDVAKKRWVIRGMNIPKAGVLRRLQRLSTWLSKDYGWQEAQAATFVLAGVAPRVTAVSAYPVMPITVRGAWRIKMDVSLATPPEKVAAEYKKLRDELMLGAHRRVSEKHQWLALFSLRFSDLKGAELLQAWNEQFPRWRYSQESNLLRDVKDAKERLLHLRLLRSDPRWVEYQPESNGSSQNVDFEE